ncbi:hypothetical protein CN884_07695 [Ochrobactrum sp. 30A/1000/2015]|nr:hypothetical protein CN884_07695 [Ochrobactrum sp. 30A/1000/2015]PJT40241.1 hypothetical protein CN883_01680 [Ochrobactrum sp. 27A/999/2015]PJT43126.1 hypothetical protein CN882_14370 [Ochrobactrum sp. 23A/997/2015]
MRKERAFSETDIILEENGLIDFQFALIDAMNEAGMNKSQLAKAMGVSRSRVAQLFSSDANPTIKLICRAMAAVNWGVEYSPLSRKHRESSCDIEAQADAWVYGVVGTATSESSWITATRAALNDFDFSPSEQITREAA